MVDECDFRIIDENSRWIVVEKPAPLVVHPSSDKPEATLLGGLQALLACDLAGGGKLSILTRLDRETSGVVLVAKDRDAARHFGEQFERREVKKGYLAIVHGWPEWDEFDCEQPILRAGEIEEGRVWVRQRVHAEGKPCATAFTVLRRVSSAKGAFALVSCRPRTGRMHQIRVHLEYLGHPIVGDKIYGTEGEAYLEQVGGNLSSRSIERLVLPRQALHSTRLEVSWSGQSVVWESPLPPDLTRFLDELSLGERHG